jgi:hypothetical protein
MPESRSSSRDGLFRGLLRRARGDDTPQAGRVPARLGLARELADQVAHDLARSCRRARRERRRWNSLNNIVRAKCREEASDHARELADTLRRADP